MRKQIGKAITILIASSLLFIATGCLSTNAGSSTSKEVSKPKLYLVGDSTVSPFDDATYYYPRAGYGTKIGNYLDRDKIEVVNLALSGRSSKSFLIERNYWNFVDNIKEGDFIMIGFGHNDEKTESGRYTNPNLSIKDEKSFKYSLYENYIKIALEAKATPILCTPIVRRTLSDTLTGSAIHQTGGNSEYPGGDYSEAIRELAKELKLELVDNTALTKALYEEVGPDVTLNFHAWTSMEPGSVDNTHTNAYGAAMISYMIANDLKASNSKLSPFILAEYKKPELSSLKANELEKKAGYTAPTTKSSVWTTTEPWLGSTFGDIGGAAKISEANFTISESSDGVSMSSGTEAKSAGKIASKSDGIAMYFQKIAADKDFTLTATATVKFIMSNSQVSFGLMVRDAVWIDESDASLLSSYVTAGPLKITNGDGAYLTSFNRVYNSTTQVSSQPGTVASSMPTPVAGSVVDLKIVKKGSTYSVTYGSEATVDYTVDLADVDSDNVYAGLYTARQCAVDYSNIVLTVN